MTLVSFSSITLDLQIIECGTGHLDQPGVFEGGQPQMILGMHRKVQWWEHGLVECGLRNGNKVVLIHTY